MLLGELLIGDLKDDVSEVTYVATCLLNDQTMSECPGWVVTNIWVSQASVVEKSLIGGDR